MFCLDSNVLIAALGGRHPAMTDHLTRALDASRVALPAIVLFELRYGVVKSARPGDNARRLDTFLRSPLTILKFTADDATEAAGIHARRREATLVTANIREFTRVPGLRLEDWTQP